MKVSVLLSLEQRGKWGQEVGECGGVNIVTMHDRFQRKRLTEVYHFLQWIYDIKHNFKMQKYELYGRQYHLVAS